MKSAESKFSPSWKFPRLTIVRSEGVNLVTSIVDILEKRLRRRLFELCPKPLGLATGRTMEPIYEALVARLRSWSASDLERLLYGWCSFNLDEYAGLKDGDDRSFRSYMSRHLGGPLQLNADKLRLPDGQAKDLHKESCCYTNQLKSYGGVGVQLLGLGSNGHVGFNEPPSSPDLSCRLVSLSHSTRVQNAFLFNGDPLQVPSQAITLGLNEILGAEEIHLIVTGHGKADILKELLHSPCSPHLPASWLRLHKNVSLWVDQAANSKALLKVEDSSD